MATDSPNSYAQQAPTASEDSVPVSEAVEQVEGTPVPQVTAQEQKVVGDDNLPDPREPQADVTQDEVDAQVVQPREGDADKVSVHEVVVTTDEVITDPSSPLAVQVPDAGRGDLSLPIHNLAAPRPEDVFASEAGEASEVSDEDREAARREGRSV